MRHTFCVALLLAIAISTSPLWAQRQLSPAMDAFTKKDYATYLTGMAAEIGPVTKNSARSFDRLVALAIALEKTNGWEGERAKLAREELAQTPDALRYLDGLKLLLAGDTRGVTTLYAGKPPKDYSMFRAEKMLHDHGFPLAEQCITAISPSEVGKCVYAWMSIPKAQREPLDPVMFGILHGTLKPDAAHVAISMYVTANAKSAIVPEECLQLALQLGAEKELYSLQTIMALILRKKASEALRILKEAERLDPENLTLPLTTVRELRGFNFDAEALTVYRETLKKLPSPQARTVRTNYLQFLQNLRRAKLTVAGADDLDANPLLAADARQALEETADAGQRYATLVNDLQQPLGIRLDAWGGLLGSDPGAALVAAPGLLKEIAALAPTARRPLFLWYGRCLRAAQEHTVNWAPYEAGASEFAGATFARKFTEAPGWEQKIADLYTRLLTIDAVTCLRPEPDAFRPSLRQSIFCAYLQAGLPENAAEILTRRVEYDIPAPPGGWKMYDGTSMPNADKPRHCVTLTRAEIDRQLDQLTLSLRQTRMTALWGPMAQVNILVARDDVRDLPNGLPSTSGNGRTGFEGFRVVEIAHHLSDAQVLLSPSKADVDDQHLPTVTDEQLATMSAIIHDALASDAFARNAASMLPMPDGIAVTVVGARTPRLQEFAFSLVTQVLDRYAVVTNPANAAREATNIAKIYDGYKIPSYAQRLREKYPLPAK